MSKDRSLFNPPSTRFADEQRTQMRQIQRPVEEPVKEQRVEVNEAQHLNIDSCIKRLIQVGMNKQIGKSVCLNSSEITAICRSVYEIFMNQPALLQLNPGVKVAGDIHGQFFDLIRLFQMCGYPPSTNYLFLGDYVDRGMYSLETILLLLCFKIKYPENFFLLRGNHESSDVTRIYGFYDESAIIGNRIFCVHGGLSPFMKSMDEINALPRPTEVPEYGLLNDLLWSDPSDLSADWSENDRGVSVCFGRNNVNEFLQRFDLDLICRAHMVVEDGYEFFSDRSLVTIFSAPNYCGEFDNYGAVMTISKDLLCSFELLPPAETVISHEKNLKKSSSSLQLPPS
ncbi:hypothetical protein G6F57_001959 [Rhizopus arrhizus]|nr:hypothetical protein G6F24_000370 [Rhizopus arrhizus]KAG0816829.1 hypothetical protein G6F20_002876 [Rhizopus arrhizus]KAG0842401.1 hypothetical protein G6F18_002774 [Rhizopus arrhizus]KAG0858455.1 hypothetical protein G6F17_002780 [Rhizopus arrhizus]KAG0887048.1 hypothetical protein G6F15_002807 [Rhizopus arrhizus]